MASHQKPNDQDTRECRPAYIYIDFGKWGRAERITAIICLTFILLVLISGVTS